MALVSLVAFLVVSADVADVCAGFLPLMLSERSRFTTNDDAEDKEEEDGDVVTELELDDDDDNDDEVDVEDEKECEVN